MQFNSLGAFALYLMTVPAKNHTAIKHGLEEVGKVVEAAAKKKFGVYQSAQGPFPEWAQLATRTQEDRARDGFTPNDPLLRSGALQGSVHHKVDMSHKAVAIGSEEDVMVYQELGTNRIPPRPVLGPAAFESKDKIKRILGKAYLKGLLPPGAGTGLLNASDYESSV